MQQRLSPDPANLSSLSYSRLRAGLYCKPDGVSPEFRKLRGGDRVLGDGRERPAPLEYQGVDLSQVCRKMRGTTRNLGNCAEYTSA